jgi:ketosteroid isomerase-like protein
MHHATKHPADAEQIGHLLDAYAAAIRAKDAPATVACYARDAVAFDLAPPLRIAPDAVRDPRYIQQWFDTWDGPIETEGRDLQLVAGDDVAYGFELRHMTGTKTDGETVDLWFRSTACLRKDDGGWKIAHVHNSVPFAMDGSDRALLDLEP